MAIFQCDLRRKNYGALWNNLFNFFHLSGKFKFRFWNVASNILFVRHSVVMIDDRRAVALCLFVFLREG